MSQDTQALGMSRGGISRFFADFWANAASTGASPRKSIGGFIVAWIVFFGIMFLMPLPEGLSPAGKATLAVVTWACIVWVSEAIPVGMTGIAIPMLLFMSGAVERFPGAVAGSLPTPTSFAWPRSSWPPSYKSPA